MIEIERKFLLLSDGYRKDAFKRTEIHQGYLNSSKERTVRVRLKGDQAYLTIKGKSSFDGTERFEWEKEIDKSEGLALLELCEEISIEKMRYEVKVGKHIFEVDEFFGDNLGLVLAEVELDDKNEGFEKPDWLGQEVTGEKKYYNSQLSKHPYKQWK